MDPTQIKKMHAMNRYKKRQFLDNLYLYFLTALTCSVFCCITFCLPYFSSLVRVVFFVCIPSFVSVLLSSKLLFIIGNLIIFALIVDSRILLSHPSSTTDVYYDEFIKSSQTQRPQIPNPQLKKPKLLDKHAAGNVDMNREDGEGLEGKGWVEGAREVGRAEANLEETEQSALSASEELNKRADEFIARVNRQRRLELSPLECRSY